MQLLSGVYIKQKSLIFQVSAEKMSLACFLVQSWQALQLSDQL